MQIEEPVQKPLRRRLRRVHEDSEDEPEKKPDVVISSALENVENTRPSVNSSFKNRLLRIAMEGEEDAEADDKADDKDFALNVDNDVEDEPSIEMLEDSDEDFAPKKKKKAAKPKQKKAAKAVKPTTVANTLKTGNKLIGEIADTDLLND